MFIYYCVKEMEFISKKNVLCILNWKNEIMEILFFSIDINVGGIRGC